MTSPCEIIHQHIADLYECEQVNDFTRVRTPYLYPDGDLIDLYVKANPAGVLTVTDLGETLRWLRMQTTTQKRTLRAQQLIADVVMTHGIELYRGMLLRRSDEAHLTSDVYRVAQAAIRVADLWFTFRSRAGEVVTDEVEEFLQQNNIPFVRDDKMIGRSGKGRQVDFHTRQPGKSSLIYVLTTSSRAAASRVVEHVVTTWYDLSNLKAGSQPLDFISLFDDTADVWTQEDINLVGNISDVAYWSRPRDLLQMIAA